MKSTFDMECLRDQISETLELEEVYSESSETSEYTILESVAFTLTFTISHGVKAISLIQKPPMSI